MIILWQLFQCVYTLVFILVPFLGMVSLRDPFKGCWWPPTVTDWITWLVLQPGGALGAHVFACLKLRCDRRWQGQRKKQGDDCLWETWARNQSWFGFWMFLFFLWVLGTLFHKTSFLPSDIYLNQHLNFPIRKTKKARNTRKTIRQM